MKKNKSPKVTIICLTYNHERFIRDSLDGFIEQKTTFPFEAMVIDDCSTDSTASIVQEYEQRYPDIIKPVYRRKRQHLDGLPNLMELLLQSVKSQYVAFCDGDDYWNDPYKLQKQVDFLDTHAEYVVCYHDAIIINEVGEEKPLAALRRADKQDFSREELMFVPRILKLTMCFRNVVRDFPEEFFKVFNVDRFLIAMLGQHGKGKYLGDIILPAAYRHQAKSMWSSLTAEEQEVRTLNTRLWIYHYYVRSLGQAFALRFLYENIFLYIFSMKNRPYRKALELLKQREQEVKRREKELGNIKYLLKYIAVLFFKKVFKLIDRNETKN